MSKALNFLHSSQNVLKMQQFLPAVSRARFLSTSANLCGLVRFTPEERRCHRNKQKHLHRNDVLEAKRVFYRGEKKIDWSQGKPRYTRVIPPYQPIVDAAQSDTPVDDVFFISKFKPQLYGLLGAVEQLKHNCELDFIHDSSVVRLRVKLTNIEGTGGKKRRRKGTKKVKFLTTTEVPHPFDNPIKVGVFTDQDFLIEMALANGAHDAGNLLLIRNVLNNIVACDSYLCTEEYARIISDHEGLAAKLGDYVPNRNNSGLVTEDTLLAKLNAMRSGVQLDNLGGDGDEALVNVGTLSQPAEELAANIRHVTMQIREAAKGERKTLKNDCILGASVLCTAEDIAIEKEALPAFKN